MATSLGLAEQPEVVAELICIRLSPGAAEVGVVRPCEPKPPFPLQIAGLSAAAVVVVAVALAVLAAIVAKASAEWQAAVEVAGSAIQAELAELAVTPLLTAGTVMTAAPATRRRQAVAPGDACTITDHLLSLAELEAAGALVVLLEAAEVLLLEVRVAPPLAQAVAAPLAPAHQVSQI